ncbi:MAG: hypothetical protein RLN90_14545 [Balneolaceae bacterium]
MRNSLLLLIAFSCASPDYQPIIDELEKSRQEVAKENARKINLFQSSISELKDCYNRKYPQLDSAYNSLAQLTKFKQQIVNSTPTTEFSELRNKVKEFEKMALKIIDYHKQNPLSNQIDEDFIILNSEQTKLPTNVLKQLLISKLERWNLLSTELKMSRYAIDPCSNPHNR